MNYPIEDFSEVLRSYGFRLDKAKKAKLRKDLFPFANERRGDVLKGASALLVEVDSPGFTHMDEFFLPRIAKQLFKVAMKRAMDFQDHICITPGVVLDLRKKSYRDIAVQYHLSYHFALLKAKVNEEDLYGREIFGKDVSTAATMEMEESFEPFYLMVSGEGFTPKNLDRYLHFLKQEMELWKLLLH